MQFSKNPRKTIETYNYNPGPGYYLNQENDQQLQNQQQFENKQKQHNSCTFSKEKRWQQNKISPTAVNLGPGSYNMFRQINQNSAEKKQPIKKQIKVINNKDQYVKVHAIPSIPSHQYTSGYQEIGDGLLVLMKSNSKKDNTNIGPGYYQVNYDLIKKNTPNFSIKKEINNQQLKKENSVNNNSSFQVELVRQEAEISKQGQLFESELSDYQQALSRSQNQNRDRSRYQNSSQAVAQISQQEFQQAQQQEKSKNNISTQIKKLNMNKQKIMSLNENYLKEQTGEHNLELLVMRNKLMGKTYGPGPTTYFSQTKNSSINVKDKPVEFQCFQSNVPRFDEKLDLPNKIGPGAYNISNENNNSNNKRASSGSAKGCTFLLSKKDASFILYKDVPGPGNYEAEKGNINKNNNQKEEIYSVNQILHSNSKKNIKNRSASGDFPSAFGSSCQRFAFRDRTELVPGPGSYQTKVSMQKKRKKKTKMVQITYDNNNNSSNQILERQDTSCDNYQQSNLSNNLSNNQEFQQQQINDFDDDYRNYVFKQYRQSNINKGSSAFSSRNPRFKEQKEQELGPGIYNQEQQFIKQSFNVGNSTFSKGRGRLQFIKSALPKNIGPGQYDAKFDLVKEKKIMDISFN